MKKRPVVVTRTHSKRLLTPIELPRLAPVADST
jgi:hypothetical protein